MDEPRKKGSPRGDMAVTLTAKGLCTEDVAKIMAIKTVTVLTLLHNAVKRGLRIDRKPRFTMAMLPDEVAHWLLGEIPEGSTLADILAAIVCDAYYEEH